MYSVCEDKDAGKSLLKNELNMVCHHARQNLATHLGAQHEYVLKVEALMHAVDAMKVYGLTLPDIERKVVVDLSDALIEKLNHFIVTNQYEVPTAQHFALFETEFNKLTHSKDNEMKQHRHVWFPILLNIGIALTGVGLVLIGVQLVTSKLCTGHACFFFEKTKRQDNIDAVQQSMNELSAHVQIAGM